MHTTDQRREFRHLPCGISEMSCYVNEESREFDLPIIDEELAQAALLRLREMGVRIVKYGATN